MDDEDSPCCSRSMIVSNPASFCSSSSSDVSTHSPTPVIKKTPSRGCRVCSAPAESKHFGVWSCRACAAFFRRALSQRERFRCPRGNLCEISTDDRSGCRACRLKKCLHLGMRPLDVPAFRDFAQRCGFATGDEPDSIDKMTLEAAPYLRRMHAAYQQLSDWRSTMNKKPLQKLFQTAHLEEQPVPISYRKYLEEFKRNVTLDADFTALAFEEFPKLAPDQKTIMFRHFFLNFCCVDTAYMTYRSGQTSAIVQRGGEIFDATSIETFARDAELTNIEPEKIVALATPLQVGFIKTIVGKIAELKVDEVEILVLAAFIFWSIGIEGMSETTEAFAKKARSQVVDECLSYYRRRLLRKDAALRLAKLLLVIPAVEEHTHRFQSAFEYANAFRMHNLSADLEALLAGNI